MRVHGVEEDRAELVIEIAVVRNPLGIWGPDDTEVGSKAAVGSLVNQDRLSRGHIYNPDAKVLVAVCNVLGVGRPRGVVEEAGLGAEVDDCWRLEPGLVAQVELVFARGVGEIGDGFPIRTPRRIALGNGRRVGQVARVTFFGRDGKDFAMSLKDGPRTRWRERRVLNLIRSNGGEASSEGGQFAVNGDGDDLVAVGVDLEQVNGAELLIHKAARAALNRFQIEAGVGADRADLLRAGVIAIERDRAVAVERK
jgi:hypothetical protein